MAREIQVTFDCADPGALASFWAETLGYVVQPPPAPFESWDQALDAWGVPPEARNTRSAVVDPDGSGPRVFFQRVPEGKTALDALTQQDLPVIVGIVLFGAAAIVVANILVDIMYVILDPRVRLH